MAEPSEALIEQQHGRIECLEYHVLSTETLAFDNWPHAKTIGFAVHYRKERQRKGSLGYSYYISSAKLDVENKSVRSHWGIENQLHWLLDVAMREDDCQIYLGDAAQNLACFRQVALNQLKRKKRLASMDSNYLQKVISA